MKIIFKNLLIFTLGFVSVLHAETADKPNVVLFLVDDMGWMDSGVYGSKYYETPHMDKLAKQSMLFTDAYAHPLCSPTRASILSGQYPSRHGITTASGHQPARPEGTSRYPKGAPPNKPFLYAASKNYLDPDLITLPKVLAKAGYSTGHFGKWHLGLAPEHWPDKYGFQLAFHAQPSPGPPGSNYFSPYGVTLNSKPSSKNPGGTITDGPDGEYITDRLTDESIAFIEANKDKPFYLNLWHYGVHGPWGHKAAYTAKFAKKKDPRGEQRNPIMASMLQSVDESLGRVLAKLDELDLTENTIFIFYSDNGGNVHSNVPGDQKIAKIKPGHPRYPQIEDWRKWAGPEPPTNNAPLREGKARIYEGGQRVPLMVRWPGRIEPDSTSDAVVAAIDLYPTFLDALDLPTPKGHVIDGESILPVLEGKDSIKRKAYFTWFPHLVGAVSVRQGEYKLIRRFEPNVKYPDLVELYDLSEDVGEARNLAGKMPKKVKELQALIDGFVKETGALYPKANPNYDLNWKPAAKKPTPNRASPEVFLRKRDKNNDGSITLKEFIGNPEGRNVPALNKQFKRRDANADGKLTLKELKN
jgi:arylsulfatase A-like enzyme